LFLIGLCGTYDFNQKNDFKTKQGDIETNTNAFGNRWKTVPTCKDVALNASNDPCAENVNRRNQSAQYCDYLKGGLFACKILFSVFIFPYLMKWGKLESSDWWLVGRLVGWSDGKM